MREKAKQSLEKLGNLRPIRNYVALSNDISTSWHSCQFLPENRNKVISWANNHCVGKFSRDYSTYYFENEKDAFACKLRWSPI